MMSTVVYWKGHLDMVTCLYMLLRSDSDILSAQVAHLSRFSILSLALRTSWRKNVGSHEHEQIKHPIGAPQYLHLAEAQV